MARNLNPKCKQCRREGVKLFLRGDRCFSSKCAIVKRNYVPGVHGLKLGRGGRLSGYGQQLREKQKARRTYQILEKQFKTYFQKAIKKAGNTGAHLYELLEMRLDNAVYRAGFAVSRNLARQLVNHGHFLVNDKKVNIPSYQLKIKDKISIKPKSLKLALFKDINVKREMPEWLNVDMKELTATVIDKPNLEKSKPNFDLRAIVEFYSR